jgi:periplasmic protein TonB
MREGASRAIGYALLASVALHAIVLATLPSWRQRAAPLPPEPEPLIARVERLAPPPAPRPPEPVREARKPPAPRPKPEPRPPALVAKPAPERAAAPPPALALPPPPEPPVEASPQPAAAPPPAASAEPGTVAPATPPAPAPADVALQRYQRGVTQAAARFKRYPRVAIDNGWQGEVVVRLAIGANGRIASLAVTAGSGFPVLDSQALDMFRNAKPFVPIPPELRGREFALELRAVYDLRDAR